MTAIKAQMTTQEKVQNAGVKRSKKELARNGLAQKLVYIGYSGNCNPMDFKVECDCLSTLEDCIDIIGEYNDFDPKKVRAALSIFENYPTYRYFNIGREGSPVIYITSNAINSVQFKKACRKFAKITLATECDPAEQGIYKSFRIWWD